MIMGSWLSRKSHAKRMVAYKPGKRRDSEVCNSNEMHQNAGSVVKTKKKKSESLPELLGELSSRDAITPGTWHI